MADEEQVALLKRGHEVWNQWIKTNPGALIDLSGANLRGAYLVNAKLSGAKLSGADLSKANLRDADLRSANLFEADLNRANLFGVDISYSNLGDADLIDANLSSANLNGVNLRYADLSGANLSDANLSNANLNAAQFLHTTFEGATFTGVCIEDWQIGSSTKFKDVKCDFIFRTYDLRERTFTGRLPVDPDSTFAPGEFEQWIQVRKGALDTIDITFSDGIDWQAFFTSLEAVRQQHPDANVAMKSVEEDSGVFVARLKVETEVEGEALEKLKASVERDVKAGYDKRLAAAQGKIEGLQWSLEQTLKRFSNQTFNGPVGNVAGTNQGEMENTQHNYADEEE